MSCYSAMFFVPHPVRSRLISVVIDFLACMLIPDTRPLPLSFHLCEES